MVTIDTLCDEEVSLILSSIDDPKDRKSLAQVSKRFSRLERLTRSYLRIFDADLLFNLLPRYPNLLTFESPSPLNDDHLEFISKSCPRIEVLNLTLGETIGSRLSLTDFEDDGVCEIAKGCSGLREISLMGRKRFGDFVVTSLVNSAANLTKLDLRYCIQVTDNALKVIGESKSITSLNLRCCSSITDCGLAWLAKGSVSRILRTLVIAVCGTITDEGVLLLQNMCCLEVLDFAHSGPDVTDVGFLAIAKIRTLKELNVSWSANLTDVTLISLAQNCLELEALDLTDCELITRAGVCAFRNHGSLKSLVLSFCYSLSSTDVEQIALTCRSLRCIVLNEDWRILTMEENMKKHGVILEWRGLTPKHKQREVIMVEMETLCDEEVSLILSSIDDSKDRKSLAHVSKHFSRLECLTRSFLRVFDADVLFNLLPRYPNLLTFKSPSPLNDAHLKFISKTCPSIEVLNLTLGETVSRRLTDFGDDGVCEIAKGCCRLREITLMDRTRFGDFGVTSLVNSAANLTKLDLRYCIQVTDNALKAIWESKSITSLNLHCSSITDCGLAWLAKGYVSRILRKLVINLCGTITDGGVSLLQSMCCLEVLDFAHSRPDVTDVGFLAIAKIQTLKELNLSWSDNLTDVTLISLAQNCLKLEALDLTDSRSITRAGDCAFRNHGSLKSLVLSFCNGLSSSDVE